MKMIMAIVRPSKVEEVKDALGKLNVSGMTISEVRGHGRQKGHTAIYRGKEYSVTLLPKMKMEIVLPDDLVEETIETIMETARTGRNRRRPRFRASRGEPVQHSHREITTDQALTGSLTGIPLDCEVKGSTA